MNKHVLAAGVAIAALSAMPAAAAIIMVPKNTVQGDNVLFNNGVQTGTTVIGHTQSGTLVNFTGSTVGGGNIIRANGGQARIEGNLDALLNGVSFQLDGLKTFDELEFNLFKANSEGKGQSTIFPTAYFTLFDDLGVQYDFTSVINNGENFFGFVGTLGNTISRVEVSIAGFDGAGFVDMRQVRLEEATAAIPEPATWAMMLAGFGAMGVAMRRRRNVTISFA